LLSMRRDEARAGNGRRREAIENGKWKMEN
jgi:hypothetical protein